MPTGDIPIVVSIVSCAPIWPPANHFLKVLELAGFPQITFLKFWSLRASRKPFFKRFGISALGESHFPKGLAFPRMARVVSRMVWCFRVCRIDLFYFQIDNLLVCLYCLTCNSLFSINFGSTFA